MEVTTRLKKYCSINIINPVSSKDEHRIQKRTLFRLYDTNGIVITNIKCLAVPFRLPGTGNVTTMIPKISSILRLNDAISKSDIVYAVTFNPILLLLSMAFARANKKRFILGLHNPEFLIGKRLNEQTPTFGDRLAYLADAVMLHTVKEIHAQTETQVRLLKKAGYRGAVYYIPHFLYTTPNSKINTNNKFVALFVGRLSIVQKGIDMLEEIIDRTLSEDGSITYHIIGSGKEGEGAVRSIKRKHPDSVSLHGFISEKALIHEYKNASLFLLPSRYETPSLSLLEAQSYGIPAVAFNVAGPKDIMKQHVQGALIPPFDTEAFSYAILKLKSENTNKPQAYLKRRQEIKQIIKDRYRSDKFIRMFLQMVYNSQLK